MSGKAYAESTSTYFEDNRNSWDPVFSSPEQYVKLKLKMLRNDMCIYPTNKEIAHLKSLKTRETIDSAVHSIIDRHWDSE